ncbi:MAG: NCS2 family permease [Candidatus Omnitrophota bacterium]
MFSFNLRQRGTNLRTEMVAGLVTFMTMAYILFVNPSLLSQGGINFEAALIATALSAGITTILMGLHTNLPFALAAGMGYNVFFAFTVTSLMKVPWQIALGCVFWDGVLFLLLTLLPFREEIFRGIPMSLKLAASAGIGIFIAFIGLSNADIIVAVPSVKVGLGNLHSPQVLLALAGLIFTGFLLARKIKGAFLWGIIATGLWGMVFTGPSGATITPIPGAISDIVKMPSWQTFRQTFFQMDIVGALQWHLLPVIFTFLFFDVFDTVGSVAGLASKLNILDAKGSFPEVTGVLMVDAGGTIIGAACGTTTVTTYIESAAGVAEGGRTGLTAVTVGACFLLALFFAPFAGLLPPAAIAPALILVGLYMVEPVLKIDFTSVTEGLPAFLTIIMMPLTYNIAHGLAFGIVSYTVLNLLAGKKEKISPLMLVLTFFFVLYYAVGRVG